MASRLLYGSKPSKTTTSKPSEQPTERSSALPRKSGISVPSSRLPTSTLPPSSIPRGRPKNVDEQATPRSRLPSVTSSSSTERGPSRIAPKRTETLSPRTAALSPATGMGNFTQISSRPLPQRNRLRRKPSSHNQRALYTESATPAIAAMSESQQILHVDTRMDEPLQQASFDANAMGEPDQSSSRLARPPRFMTTTPTELATSNSRMKSYVPRDMQPSKTPDPPSQSATSAGRSCTPSTRFSESPGNFSRTSTPTSASSMSPNLVQTPKFGALPRPSNPSIGTRPPVTKRKMPILRQDEFSENQGLSAVRESQTSSSSSSTVKAPESVARVETPATSKKSRLRQPAPTPPLRISSKRGQKPASLASAVSSPEATTPASATRIARPGRTPTSATAGVSGASRPSLEQQRNKPPTRPTREGTPALEAAVAENMVIRSNLPQIVTVGHKRNDSLQRVTPSTSASQSARPSLSRSASITSAGTSESLHAVASAPDVTSPHLVPKMPSKNQPTLSMRTDLHEPPSKRDPSPLSASPARSAGRFGFFSKKAKSPSETSLRTPQKLTKKGPAAGTGHEGYGRYARRGRSTSVSTAGGRGRSTSTDQTTNPMPRLSTSRKSSFNSGEAQPELDEFYKERLEPITIGGGGQIRENRNSQTSLYLANSAQSSVASFESSLYATSRGKASFEMHSDIPSSQASSNNASRELLPAPRLISTPQGIVQQQGRTLAHRRSLHRSQIMGESEGVRIPYPIDTNVSASSPAVDTYDSTLSLPQTEASFASDFSEGQEGKWLRSKKKTPDRTKSPRKWNIFRRQHRSPDRSAGIPAALNSYQHTLMEAQLDDALDPIPVAHYAIMDDTEDEQMPGQDLEQILQNIEDHLQLEGDPNDGAERYRERQPSALLPSPPLFSSQFEDNNVATSPKVSLSPSQGANVAYPVLRPSRLQQVGRIPQVISKRNQLHVPATHSFSRPFAAQNTAETSEIARASTARPMLGLKTDPLPSAQWNAAAPATAPLTRGILYGLAREDEFLRMSPRKDSGLTTSSSSSGILGLAPVTAITPSADDVLSEDEIWNEYDELLDRVSPPIFSSTDSNPIDMWSSFPDLAKTLTTPEAEYMSAIPIALSHVTSGAHRAMAGNGANIGQLAGQGGYLAPVAPFLMNEGSLNSPISLSDLYSNYGNLSSGDRSNQRLSNLTTTSGSRYSSNTIISESESPLSLDTPGGKRVTQVMAQKTATVSLDSLRFSALMTSRWLCSDRVLFSPAQEEVLNSRQTRVLVIDGLGNDDWSAYCALSYPDATVYNLAPSTRKLNARDGANAESWVPPPNLRRMSHAGIGAPFPFPKGFFTAAVFRFPAADTPAAYKNAISECKRVLKPGGYLELCILDIDMRNTGTQTRRAVRSVKERLSSARPEVSLGPTSDMVNKLLGRRGFENLNRCFVAVPLADGSSTPSGEAALQTKGTGVSSKGTDLKDLLAGQKDHGSKHNGPEMMGRVGRWWWTRCYEKDVTKEGESSLWDDEQLITECEERQTSLTLAICCAQKPESVRRRTVSF